MLEKSKNTRREQIQGKTRSETLNPMFSVRQVEISPCVKTMGEAENVVNHVSKEV